jgi:hypothetical protein
MACESHRAGLSDFLGIRGFLRETQPVDRVIDLDSGRTVTPVADASAPV